MEEIICYWRRIGGRRGRVAGGANQARRCALRNAPGAKQTPAHRTDKLAEIVCSNSLKSDEPGTASLSSERRAAARWFAGDGGGRTRRVSRPAPRSPLIVRNLLSYITENCSKHIRASRLVREEVTSHS